jgi:MerR family transcriptional regulator/heat shock protein HspR
MREEAMSNDRGLYVISVAAELAGVHPQTLRIYERKGLIEPERTEGGSRRYSDREISLLRRIHELTALGISLEGTKAVLALEDQLEDARRRIADLTDALARARDDTKDAVERVRREHRRDLVPVKRSTLMVRPPQPKSRSV